MKVINLKKQEAESLAKSAAVFTICKKLADRDITYNQARKDGVFTVRDTSEIVWSYLVGRCGSVATASRAKRLLKDVLHDAHTGGGMSWVINVKNAVLIRYKLIWEERQKVKDLEEKAIQLFIADAVSRARETLRPADAVRNSYNYHSDEGNELIDYIDFHDYRITSAENRELVKCFTELAQIGRDLANITEKARRRLYDKLNKDRLKAPGLTRIQKGFVRDVDGKLLPDYDTVKLTAGEKAGQFCYIGRAVRVGDDVFHGKFPPSHLIKYTGGRGYKPRENATESRGFLTHPDQEEYYEPDPSAIKEDILGRTFSVNVGRPDDLAYTGEEIYHLKKDVQYCRASDSYKIPVDGQRPSDVSLNKINELQGYHRTATPIWYGYGALHRVGFEVEKQDFAYTPTGSMKPSPLFTGWESDSSCGVAGGSGVEGITNVYGLNDQGQDVFFQHLEQSRDMIDGDTAPTAGGHINISGDFLTHDRIRPYAGVFYAIWRERLRNMYCRENLRILDIENLTDPKYQAFRLNIPSGRLEIRIPSAVREAEDLAFRYELTRNLTEAITEKRQAGDYRQSFIPILENHFSPMKVKTILDHEEDFSVYLRKGKISPRIARYVTNK